VLANTTLFSTIGSLPLDLVAQGDADPFPGTVWVADQGNGAIYVFEPNDFGGEPPPCTGADDPGLDEDGDGYTNADEIDNGTDPCSSADIPPDWDGDFVSNLNDPDDDNDGLPDTSDAFAIDPDNGATTQLPVSYTWENDAPDPGGLLNLGFTGLMTNGGENYEALYDPNGMTAGGAAGVTTVDQVPAGDALGATNTQQYAFQFGLDAAPASTDVFTAHTAIVGPFAGLTPTDDQSMGLFIGTGGQDDYLKIVTAANGGAGGVKVVKEVGGTVTNVTTANEALPGPEAVDLYLEVDPDAGTVQPSYSVTASGSTGARVNVGGPVSVPSSWFTGSALAVGIISTSAGPGPQFPATWDFIEATPGGSGPPPPSSTIAQDTFSRTVSDAWGSADVGGSWSVLAGTAANFDVDGDTGTIVTPSKSGQRLIHLGSTSVRDVDAQVEITVPSLPASGNYFAYVVVRRQSGGAYYRIGAYVNPSGQVFLRGQTNTGTSLFPDANTGVQITGGETVVLRVQAEGASPTTIRAKAWELGTAEPGTWGATATSSTSGLQVAGSVGIRTLNSSSAAVTLSFDDLLATAI
jgi:hypothetical protein